MTWPSQQFLLETLTECENSSAAFTVQKSHKQAHEMLIWLGSMLVLRACGGQQNGTAREKHATRCGIISYSFHQVFTWPNRLLLDVYSTLFQYFDTADIHDQEVCSKQSNVKLCYVLVQCYEVQTFGKNSFYRKMLLNLVLVLFRAKRMLQVLIIHASCLL